MLLRAVWTILLIASSCSQDLPKKKVLHIALHSEPQTFDPRRGRDISSCAMQYMLFEGLTRLLENGEIEWAGAENLKISEDGKLYCFTLRETFWTDGEPVTAKDFERSWKKSLDPSFASSSSFLFAPILNAPAILRGELSPDELGVRATSEKTLEVELTSPTPYFLSLVSLSAFYPIPTHVEELNPNWAINPTPKSFVSNGPFKLSKSRNNELFSVQKNDRYWDAAHVFLEGIDAYIISDETTCLQMFDAHELDYLNSHFVPLPLDHLERLRNADRVRINPVGATVFCAFNLEDPHLQNHKIREALSLAIDRSSIVANISQMDDIPATRIVPPALSSNPALHLLELCNPELAAILFREGLAEENMTVDQFKEGLFLSYENTERNRRIAQTIQHQWKELLGFEIALGGTEDRVHLERLERRDYSIAIDYWIAHYMDPSCILDRFKFYGSKKNYSGYENAQYIALLTEAEQMPNLKGRDQLLEKAEALLAADLPLAPLFHFNVITLQSDRFEEIKINPLGGPIFKNVKPCR